MKAADIRAKSADEQKDQLIQLKKEQFNLRFQKAAGQTESAGRTRLVRRDVARIKTIMGEATRAPAATPKAKTAEAPAKTTTAAKAKRK